MLGAVEAVDDGRPVDLGHSRQRGVLAVLLAEANHPVPIDQVVDRVWGVHPPKRGRDALYSYLSRLRAIMAPMSDVTLRRRAAGYVLTVDEDSVDLHRFRRLVDEARAAADDSEALVLFDDALSQWRGEAFADLDSPWFESVRTAVEAERRTAELDRTDAALRCGRHAERLADVTAQAARYPLDERLAGQVMLALYRSGRQADALRHYQTVREELAEQLGADPNPELQQLHQRILTADATLTAGTPSAAPRQLPPAPAGFTGRANELADLDGADGGTVVISALAGAGGIGKTWLALHWAHRRLARFPDGQLFADLRGFSPDGDALEPLTVIRGFLHALGVDPSRITGGLAEHTARYRSLIADRRMLVVLDNAATADQVVPLLPGASSCTVIVTSRTALAPLITRHNARHLNVNVLTNAESHELLVRRLGNARVAAEPDAVAELIRRCGRYPLALTIMASRAQADPDLPLADFSAELRESGLDALVDADPATSLPTVLSWSLRSLTSLSRFAFGLLGIAPGPDIGLHAAASLVGVSVSEARKVLRALVDASLLDQKPHGRFAMHDLIRAYAATTARDLDADVREAALRRVLDCYTHTARAADGLLDVHRSVVKLEPPVADVVIQPPADAAAALAWFEIEHPNLLAAQRCAADQAWHETVWHLAWAAATFHYRQGRRDDRLAMWLAALDVATEPATRMLAHRRVGRAYADLGRHEEAIGQLNCALALAEDHQDTNQQALTHQVLAWAWGHRGDDESALRHAVRTLDLYRALGQPVREASALNLAGWYFARLGEHDEARRHCQAALVINREHDEVDSVAATLDSLGYIDHLSGDHAHAVEHYHQALVLYRVVGNAYQIADTLDRLGHTQVALGQHDQAVAVWTEALASYRQQNRDEDADRVRSQLDRR